MWLMLTNNVVWVRRANFSKVWHTLHYFFAASVLVLYIPRHDWYKTMQDLKYGYTNMNIFVLQLILGSVAGLT